MKMAKHYFNRLEQLDSLIRRKGTGTPAALSKRLGVSKRTIFGYIDLLRSLGAPISYSKSRESYYYNAEGYFHFRFISKEKKGSPI
jgi:predicted DNA-binding transcriptional regulator YafY